MELIDIDRDPRGRIPDATIDGSAIFDPHDPKPVSGHLSVVLLRPSNCFRQLPFRLFTQSERRARPSRRRGQVELNPSSFPKHRRTHVVVLGNLSHLHDRDRLNPGQVRDAFPLRHPRTRLQVFMQRHHLIARQLDVFRRQLLRYRGNGLRLGNEHLLRLLRNTGIIVGIPRALIEDDHSEH